MHVNGENREFGARLPWLLVFRAAVATILLIVTFVADRAGWPIRHISSLFYGVVFSTYVVVFALASFLRWGGIAPVLLAAVHLGFATISAVMVVAATGGIDSAFSFLYLFVILDAAIIGGRRIAMVTAIVCVMAYGSQLTLQFYGDEPMGPQSHYITNFLTHAIAFALSAFLAGYLAELGRSAKEAASSAQSDLLRARELHGQILQSLPVGVITYDQNKRVHTANATAAEILAIPVRDMVGAYLPEVVRDLLSNVSTGDETVISVGETMKIIAYKKAVLAVQSDANSPIEVLAFEDRTKLRVLEHDLRERERLAAIGQMAATIAHEIRNPLAAISGSVELLRIDAAANPQSDRLSQIVVREIERLNILIEDFLEYARPHPAEFVTVDLTALAKELCEVLRRDQQWAEYALLLTMPEKIMASVDPAQIRQMLWNLLRNAKDASAPASRIELNLNHAAQGEEIIFEVRDYGTGIDNDVRKHLFEPFYTTKTRGTGLGLAVVKRIVDVHHAHIDFYAEKPGTKVKISLPVR